MLDDGLCVDLKLVYFFIYLFEFIYVNIILLENY